MVRMDTYHQDLDMIKEVLKSSAYTINRGPGGGYGRNDAFTKESWIAFVAKRK